MALLSLNETFTAIRKDDLAFELSRNICTACESHTQFSIEGTAQARCDDQVVFDAIYVRVHDLSVASRNPGGILSEEPLAIIVSRDEGKRTPLDVRALRSDFPDCMHMNLVFEGEPKALCLYSTPWAVLRRSWTPERFLAQIIWWLEAASEGNLHQADQPLEQFFLYSNCTVIVPSELRQTAFTKSDVLCVDGVYDDGKYVRLNWAREIARKKREPHGQAVPLMIGCPPVVHGQPLKPVRTLNELILTLSAKGVDLLKLLKDAVEQTTSSSYVVSGHFNNAKTLLILALPKARLDGEDPEAVDIWAFYVDINFARLGTELGVLSDIDGQMLRVPIIGATSAPVSLSEATLSAHLDVCAVQFLLDPDSARNLSGITKSEGDFCGILAGVGSLGSTLADIWSKMGWGTWDYVDHDVLLPHNVQRHIGREGLIITPKTSATRMLTNSNFDHGVARNSNDKVEEIYPFAKNLAATETASKYAVLVDATASADVGRDLSQVENIPRCASVFLTPSGNAAVALIEDLERQVRLECLETQYYRLLIREDIGNYHFVDPLKKIQVGATCTEMSLVLPYDKVVSKAGAISVHLRQALSNADASVWIAQSVGPGRAEDSILAHAEPTRALILGAWTIVIDEEIIRLLHTLRKRELPNETGGILLGYADHFSKRLYIVEALGAPGDSISEEDNFTRGIAGLQQLIEVAEQRTGGVVTYVGEWHSHPDKVAPIASRTDLYQMQYLVSKMKEQGDLALMAIVGKDNINLYSGLEYGPCVEVRLAAI